MKLHNPSYRVIAGITRYFNGSGENWPKRPTQWFSKCKHIDRDEESGTAYDADGSRTRSKNDESNASASFHLQSYKGKFGKSFFIEHDYPLHGGDVRSLC